MTANARILDHVVWFRHLDDDGLRMSLDSLAGGEPINLEAGGIVGRWLRMEPGKDGRPTPGIKPDGSMKAIWNEWFRNRKGEAIEIRQVAFADDYLKAGAALFSEWQSEEDEKAFRDL